MDTSEQYIKMCDCEEIQKDHIIPEFDDYYHTCHEVKCLETRYLVEPITVIWGMFEGWNYHRGDIWLPRQDQLQEMLRVTDIPFQSVAWVGYLLCLLQYDIGLRCTSMEQLWLAFVMKEKFNKTWDGEKWIDP